MIRWIVFYIIHCHEHIHIVIIILLREYNNNGDASLIAQRIFNHDTDKYEIHLEVLMLDYFLKN